MSLVGYTNAGKSTILNQLTAAGVEAKDALFVTLDTTTRKVELPNHQPLLMSDTVGFINKLPHHLVNAFKATLEEVQEADLLIHVCDAASERVDEQIDAVKQVLMDLGIDDKPVLLVLNKADVKMGQFNAGRLKRLHEPAVVISAKTGQGMDDLLAAVADQLRDRFVQLFLRLPQKEARLYALLQSDGLVQQQYYLDEDMLLQVRVPPRISGHYKPYLIDNATYDQYIVRSEERG